MKKILRAAYESPIAGALSCFDQLNEKGVDTRKGIKLGFTRELNKSMLKTLWDAVGQTVSTFSRSGLTFLFSGN